MMKTDLFKRHKSYYSATTTPELVTVESATYLSLQGRGDPSGPAYGQNLEALYAVAYTLKFGCKARGQDFVVARLEAQWWFDEQRYGHISMEEAPLAIPRSEWDYRLLIRLPGELTEADVSVAKTDAAHKKNRPGIERVQFFEQHEGLCVQMLHIGAFDREPESLVQIRAFCEQHALRKNGLHHEIYLSDFRRTKPGKLRTILREPVS